MITNEQTPAANGTLESPLTESAERDLVFMRIRLARRWPSWQEVKAALAELHADEAPSATTRLLVDLRGLPLSSASRWQDLKRLESAATPGRHAYVTEEGWQDGLCRQLCLIAARRGGAAQVFRDEPEAVRWLVGEECGRAMPLPAMPLDDTASARSASEPPRTNDGTHP